MGGKKRSSFAFVFGQNAPPPLESLDRYTHEVWTGVDKKRGADVGADDLHRVGHALAQGLLHAVVKVGVGRGVAHGKAHLGVLLGDGGDELDLGAMRYLHSHFVCARLSAFWATAITFPLA